MEKWNPRRERRRDPLRYSGRLSGCLEWIRGPQTRGGSNPANPGGVGFEPLATARPNSICRILFEIRVVQKIPSRHQQLGDRRQFLGRRSPYSSMTRDQDLDGRAEASFSGVKSRSGPLEQHEPDQEPIKNRRSVVKCLYDGSTANYCRRGRGLSDATPPIQCFGPLPSCYGLAFECGQTDSSSLRRSSTALSTSRKPRRQLGYCWSDCERHLISNGRRCG